MNTSVLQDWLVQIPIRMQSTLLLSLRGPDTHACPGVKAIQRWMRGLTFKPGNPDNVREFMGGPPPMLIEKNAVAKELEFCSQHFYSHLMHGLEVIAYCHCDPSRREIAFDLFRSMCTLMHLDVESKATFELRLCERAWPNGQQPNDFTEALHILAEAGNA